MGTSDRSFKKLASAFNRAFAAEREQLTPGARATGSEVGRFLYMLCRDAMEHPRTRAAAVKAIDEFSAARMR